MDSRSTMSTKFTQKSRIPGPNHEVIFDATIPPPSMEHKHIADQGHSGKR